MKLFTSMAQLLAAGVLAASIGAATAQQSYPSRPVRIIVPYVPGGAADFVARVVGQKVGEAWGQSVVVDNRAGGGGNIGAELAARAAPDGHTLFVAGAANAVNMTLYSNVSYDIVKDFSPVSLMTTAPLILVVHASVPARSVKDLIALAKARPGELNYASGGTGSSPHLSAELFKKLAGVDIMSVPYKGGGGSVMTDLLAGRVSIYFSSIVGALPHVKVDRLRALAVTGVRRSQVVPDLPTLNESGLKGYEMSLWQGLLAPAATSREIVTKLHADVVRILALPEVRDKFAAQSIEIAASSPAEFAAYIKAEIAKYAMLVKTSGIRPD